MQTNAKLLIDWTIKRKAGWDWHLFFVKTIEALHFVRCRFLIMLFTILCLHSTNVPKTNVRYVFPSFSFSNEIHKLCILFVLWKGKHEHSINFVIDKINNCHAIMLFSLLLSSTRLNYKGNYKFSILFRSSNVVCLSPTNPNRSFQ